MAGDEHQAQEVIPNMIVNGSDEIRRRGFLTDFEIVAKLIVFALKQLSSAKLVDCTILCRGHEPGTRVIRNAGRRPTLKRRDKSILRQVFG
jgi:hypothetical protein